MLDDDKGDTAATEQDTDAVSTEGAEEQPAAAAPTVRKTTRKRAGKKAAAPVDPPSDDPAGPPPATAAPSDDPAADGSAGGDAPAAAGSEALPDESAPAPQAKKRAPRKKAAAKAAATPEPAEGPVPDPDGPAAALVDADAETPPAPAKKKRASRSRKVTPAPAEETPPAETPVEAPVEAPGEAPVEAPGEAPVEAAAERAPGEAEAGAETEGEAGRASVAPLFQAPERTRRGRRARAADQPEEATPEDATPEEATVEAAPDEPGQAADAAETAGDTERGGEEPDDGTATRRRRRRGGRRRRRGADDQAESSDTEDEDAEPTEPAADAGGDSESGSSRRRRRRRRAGEEGDGGSDDPDKTVTRVRRTRSPEDEITAVTGSTRLEAKKQRRREGREAGRRRAPIVSEAEFLARRESVERVMAIRQRDDVTQIAVLEDKVLVEHYVARESQTSLIGNVYLGRVQNVLPSMEAAFIDIGKGRNAVLYAGEVNWSALGHQEGQPRKIESVLSSGQAVLVQVTKDPVGHKGARLTSQISLAGRFLVYVPDGTTSGISRKLPDTERNRLKSLLKEIVPDSAGVIVRTAAEGAAEDELTRDVERLKARWDDIERKAAKGNSPQLLYGEPDLTLKVVRDLFTEDFSRLVIEGADAWETVQGYVAHVAPDLEQRLERYDPRDAENGGRDLFSELRIEEQIHKGLDRKVWLPSGGSLIIDRTEAMTVVDVNTGKFTGSGGNLEETVTKNNLEAAEEIVRQLRLRDIGGIIVVDFIDMVLESNRDLVLRRLVECLGRDRTRHQVAEVTSLGLVQMTRKRIGTGLLEAFSETCEHCGGRGVVVADAPIEPKRSEEPAGRSARRSRGGRTRGGEDRPETRPENGARPAVPSPRDLAAMAKEHAASPADAAETSAPEAVGSETGVGAGVEAAGSAAAPARVEQLEPAGTPEAVETDTAWAGTLEPDTVEPEEAVVPPVGDPEAASLLDEAEAAQADAAGETTDPADEPGDSAADSAGDSTGDSTDDSAGQPPADPTADRTGDATADPTGDAAAEPTPAAPEPRVVTRTRRRAASRPAGPPAAAPAKTAAPAVGEGSAASAGPATGDGPGQGGQDVETAAGVPDEDGGDHDVPHFEHVPIKRKGRKR